VGAAFQDQQFRVVNCSLQSRGEAGRGHDVVAALGMRVPPWPEGRDYTMR
jgi:hypothetical protein